MRVSPLAVVLMLLGPRFFADASEAFPKPDITTAADSVVAFNEVMYHPAGDNPALEWIEFYNAMSVDIDLSDWRIEGGIDFQFSAGTTILANRYVVVASDPAALQAQAGDIPVMGRFTKRLSNSGETLRLRNNNGRLMDAMSYSDQAPWPVAADGSGGSLAKKERFSASSRAENWRVSARVGGTPGAINFVEDTSAPPEDQPFINGNSPARWFVPVDDSLGGTWTAPLFDDANWNQGTAAPGFFEGPSGTTSISVARAYSFDGSFADSSGHGIGAQNNGADFSANVPAAVGAGQSVQFDGVADHVRVPDVVNPLGYSIAAWVLVTEVRACSLIVRTDNSGPNTSWSHQLRINSAGRFEHYLFDGGQRSVAATNIIEPGIWYHVAATATNGGPMRIYVNGVSSGGTVNIGNLWSGGDQWRFGTDSGHTPDFFRGNLDEIGIWDVVLGPGEITALASGTRPTLLNGYLAFITTNIQAALFQKNSSLLLRVPFVLPPNAYYDTLTLNLRYDDGFVAYLNGTEVARRNAPQLPAWNSAATAERAGLDVVQPETIDLSGFAGSLVPGTNLFAVQALNASASDNDFLFHAELSGREAPLNTDSFKVRFNEAAPAGAGSFFIELSNPGLLPAQLSGSRILSSAGPQFWFGPQTLNPPGFLTLDTSALGFSPAPGDRLFLIGPRDVILDAVEIQERLRGRSASGDAWLYSLTPSPGGSNFFSFHDEIVINEVMYHFPPTYRTNSSSNPVENSEQWIELYNRSAASVDLTGWQITGGARWTFPAGTILAAGEFLVVAGNNSVLRAKYPGVRIVGDWEGRLSHRADEIILLDAQGNPADTLNYYDDFPWPAYADGGGSSLELRDPASDNAVPEAWAASIEGPKAAWRRYQYQAKAVTPPFSPSTSFFRELRLGLLNDGEALIDNITVIELPTDAPPRQLLQNTNFAAGTSAWRLLGNHSHSRVEPDPENAPNNVLRLVANGPTSYLDNRLETTLKANGSYVAVTTGRDYEISFDARWIAGSPQLHSELYYNKVVTTHILDLPSHLGTPGQRNSTYATNAGPTYISPRNSPVVPAPGQPVTVSVEASDPDGISNLRLYYSVNGGIWRNVAMSSPDASSSFSGTIPAQSSDSVVQFFIQATDTRGARSTYPAAGTEARALIKVGTTESTAGKQTFRIIMTPADAALLHEFVNLMSDDLLGCTIVHNEREVYYDARIRLHGSMFSRTSPSSTGFTVKFPSDHLFRGSCDSLVVRRSAMVESFLKHLLNKAGGLPANYDDIIHLISHRSDNRGPARLNPANYDDTFIDSQFENNNDGTVFKFEGIRIYQATDDGTPEGNKLPQPVDFAWSYDLSNLGDDPEQYRWSIMIGSQRARDDYSRIVNMGKAFVLSGTALQNAIGSAVDVEEWARLFAIQNLFGIADIYGVDNPHNVAFYVRPDDGRVVALQNDWQFAFNLSTSASIYGKQNVFKMLNLPVYRRVYQGQLLDLLDAVGDSAYITRWAQHYSAVTGENYTGAPGYIASRSASIRSQLAPQIPFEITSNGGNPFSVNTPSAALQGRAWINVREIRLAGQTYPLPIQWLDAVQWRVQAPLNIGENPITLIAYGYNGAPVGEDSIIITSTASGFAQRDNLRITELLYHPSEPNAAEAGAGFVDKNSFEFIELMNIGSSNLSLIGVRFTAGITFDFSGSSVTNLAAGSRLLLVKSRSAFEFRYGTNLPIAGEFSGQLDNAGELIQLVDSFGGIIHEFVYGDAAPWPAQADGQGPSLEIVDTGGNYGNAANWRASAVSGGTPGRNSAGLPLFIAIRYEGTQIQMDFEAAAGQGYTVFWTENLSEGQWSTLTTVAPGDSVRIETIRDEMSIQSRQRYYMLSTP